jgi:hypothetical protein
MAQSPGGQLANHSLEPWKNTEVPARSSQTTGLRQLAASLPVSNERVLVGSRAWPRRILSGVPVFLQGLPTLWVLSRATSRDSGVLCKAQGRKPAAALPEGGVVLTETPLATSELLWRATLIAALVDIPLLIIVARSVSSALFGELKWYLAGSAFAVYATLWGAFGSIYFWESVYKAIFPLWFRWYLPAAYGLLFSALAVVFWRISVIAPRWQAVWFTVLGGAVSIVGHSIGISRGLLRVPLLAQVSALSALAFGVFEFIFYWCVIIGLGAAMRWVGLRFRYAQA